MSGKERRRLVLMHQVRSGQLKLTAAGELMGVSYRQAKRVWRRWRAQGDGGLVHGLRGRPGNARSRRAGERGQALKLYADRYGDFGPTLAAEYLRAEHGLELDHETLRRWLVQGRLWKVRRERRRRQRQWRVRKEHTGQMVQMDGSHHDWFEGRPRKLGDGRVVSAEPCVLMVMVDDATNWTYAQFHTSEDTLAAMSTFRGYVMQRGLPGSLYVDKDSIYRVNRPATQGENLALARPRTQFEAAMAKLGVAVQCAHSPQAKGRVERRNGLLQDRLVKALRLEGIGDIQAANEFLLRRFLSQLNEQFTVAAAGEADVHRPVSAGELEAALVLEETRMVNNDWTIPWRGQWLQLVGSDCNRGLAGQRVVVRTNLQGELSVWYRGRALRWRRLPARPSRINSLVTAARRVAHHAPAYKPPANHPWRNPGQRSGAMPAAAGVGCAAARCARLRYANPSPTQGTVLLS